MKPNQIGSWYPARRAGFLVPFPRYHFTVAVSTQPRMSERRFPRADTELSAWSLIFALSFPESVQAASPGGGKRRPEGPNTDGSGTTSSGTDLTVCEDDGPRSADLTDEIKSGTKKNSHEAFVDSKNFPRQSEAPTPFPSRPRTDRMRPAQGYKRRTRNVSEHRIVEQRTITVPGRCETVGIAAMSLAENQAGYEGTLAGSEAPRTCDRALNVAEEMYIEVEQICLQASLIRKPVCCFMYIFTAI